MKNIKIACIAVFCVLIYGFAALSLLLPQKQYSDMENRALEQRPEVSLDGIKAGEYQKQYEKYLSDQIYFRDGWVKLASTMERLAGRREMNGVYIGKDGYLLEKYQESEFDQGRVEENIRFLSSFLNDMCDTYGKQHVLCMMLPSKANAMPDKLPAYAPVNEEGRVVEDLRKKLEEPERLLDVSKTMQSRQDEYIYYRTDHHWTTLGAYYAYCDWAGKMGYPCRPLEGYQRETAYTDFYGTTYNKIHIDVPMDEVELFHGPGEKGVRVSIPKDGVRSDSFYFPKAAEKGFNRYQVFLSKNTDKIKIRTKAGSGKRLLLIKDSFANCFVPFLAEHYDEITLIDCRYSKENIRAFLKKHGKITDVLVMYNVEKFMQDTNLKILDKKSDSVKKFNLDDFWK